MGLFDRFKKRKDYLSFAMLDSMIHKKGHEIILHSNVILSEDEEFSGYGNGINIDLDDVCIDGNGKTIESINTKIFNISGKNIRIKNLTFKNGFDDVIFIDSDAQVEFINCRFINNKGRNSIIYNKGQLKILNSIIKNNILSSEGNAIVNDVNARLFIRNSSFKYNKYADDHSSSKDILNKGFLVLIKSEFKTDSKSIFNEGNIKIFGNEDYYNEIRNIAFSDTYNIKIITSLNINEYPFSFLDELIHNDASEIVLENDVKLDIYHNEEFKYLNGINLDVDDIIIDGNGHVIDSQGYGSIFNISGKNIIFKNLIFRNASSNENTIIRVNKNSSIQFNNCYFIGHNLKEGQLIKNYGKIQFDECTFEENFISNNCSLILNKSNIEIIDTIFQKNDFKNQDDAFIIYNESELILKSSIFKNNSSFQSDSAMINNSSDMEIVDTKFMKNNRAIVNSGKLEIVDSQIRDNKCYHDGAGIYNYGDVEIINVEFTNNSALSSGISSGYGGSIFNKGNIKIDNSLFANNKAYPGQGNGERMIRSYGDNVEVFYNNGHGGAIYNRGDIEILNSHFQNNKISGENVRGESIYSGGYMKIEKCTFSNHENVDIILNKKYLEIFSSIFENNNIESPIINCKSANLNLNNITVMNNWISKSIVTNFGELCDINKSNFKSNVYENDSCHIINEGTLNLRRVKFGDEPRIVNSGFVNNKDKADFIDELDNNGNNYDFNYLDKKIQEASSNHLILEHDILFEKYEQEFYEGGIELYKDNFIIDGNGKTIDGSNLSRIFIVSAKNVTLKNIIFKNALVTKNKNNISKGGVLFNTTNSTLKLENCQFIDNSSKKEGGVIYNNGKIMIDDNLFENNKIGGDYSKGGVIYNNYGEIDISNTEFKNNMIDKDDAKGGAIYNNSGKISIENSKFIDNKLNGLCTDGAVINNFKGKIKIFKSIFESNSCMDGTGGVVYNEGQLNIFQSVFLKNISDGFAGAIYNLGTIVLEENAFSNNKSSKAGAIFSSGEITLKNNKFKSNYASFGDGGAIYNLGKIEIYKTFFERNLTSNGVGGAINNESDIKVYDCCFIGNSSSESEYNNGGDGGAIFNLGNMVIHDSNFVDNSADGILYYGYGSAINNKGDIEIYRTRFSNNKATQINAFLENPVEIGAAVVTIKDKYVLKDCEFINNSPKDLLEE